MTSILWHCVDCNCSNKDSINSDDLASAKVFVIAGPREKFTTNEVWAVMTSSHKNILLHCELIYNYNWMVPWKNRISSTTMKLRKSLVKPVMWQNILSCLVLPPENIMHDELKCYSLKVRRFMRHRAWRSRVEEPNNT